MNNWERQVTAEPRAIYRPAGGLTPLLYAAREGCVECAARSSMAAPTSTCPIPEGISPLLMAVINMRFDTARAPDPARREPEHMGLLGPRAALRRGRPEHDSARRPARSARRSTRRPALQVVELLLEAGANPNAQLKLSPPFRNIGNDRGLDGMLTTGATPLLRAAKALDAPAIRVLLAKGADIVAGQLARHHAADGGGRAGLGRRRHARLLSVARTRSSARSNR